MTSFNPATTWIVTRHGSNAANQSMTPFAILGTVEAETEAEAMSIAAEKYHCYANQRLTLENWREADSEDCNIASEADANAADCQE